MNKLKVSVIGTGYLGNIHCKLLSNNNFVDFVGVYDIDNEKSSAIADEYKIKNFTNVEETITNSDALIIVVPTTQHYEIAMKCLAHGKHCFIEKPVTSTVSQANDLYNISLKNPHIKIQVGHIERFNPAVQAALKYPLEPMFIEAHRLTQFRPRATDVSVVHDLMIHDIDLVLWLVKSPVKSIDANGLSVITNTIDIANARIKFENGAVANLTASRLSVNSLRKIRFFQRFGYISIDLSNPNVDVFRLLEGDENCEHTIPASMLGSINTVSNELNDAKIVFENPKIIQTNAMADEQTAFIQSIINDTTPYVPLEQAIKSLEVAEKITELINPNF